MDCETRRVHK